MSTVGIDLVDVDRFAGVLERRPALAMRLFTDNERRDAKDAPERLAARFAAKEAWLKSVHAGVGAVAWRDIEVVRDGRGAPSLRLGQRASELAASAGVTAFAVSLTHTATTAGAVVVAS